MINEAILFTRGLVIFQNPIYRNKLNGSMVAGKGLSDLRVNHRHKRISKTHLWLACLTPMEGMRAMCIHHWTMRLGVLLSGMVAPSRF